MNDPFEERLRSLSPAALPPELRTRLATPPQAETTRLRRSVFVAWTALAAAACLALTFFFRSHTPDSTAVLIGSQSGEVTGVRQLSTFTDADNRLWELVEVSWEEQSTLVSASGPLAMQIRDTYHAVVPSLIHFD